MKRDPREPFEALETKQFDKSQLGKNVCSPNCQSCSALSIHSHQGRASTYNLRYSRSDPRSTPPVFLVQENICLWFALCPCSLPLPLPLPFALALIVLPSYLPWLFFALIQCLLHSFFDGGGECCTFSCSSIFIYSDSDNNMCGEGLA